jgi:hypothetical protein
VAVSLKQGISRFPHFFHFSLCHVYSKFDLFFLQFMSISATIPTHDNNKVPKVGLDLYSALGGDSELDEGDEGEHREAIGDNSTGTNWHRHTAMVLGVLQGRMHKACVDADGDHSEMARDNGANEEEEKPAQLSFDTLTSKSCRRTAASAFFEMLQLKTWDFIDLHQCESYGDISIVPGTRFNENKNKQHWKQRGR